MYKVEKLLLFSVCIVIIFLNILRIGNTLGMWGGDNAYYILLAKSIISGMGYVEIFTPGIPHHIQYPPLFPLILSPIVYLWGYNFFTMHIVIIGLGIFAILVIKVLCEEYSDKITAVFIAFLTGTNLLFLFFQHEILSEIPYLLFSLLAIYFINIYSKRDTILNSQLILASLFISATYLTRSIGITIYLASISYFALKLLYVKNKTFILKKGVAIGVLSIIPYLLWSTRNIVLRGKLSGYLSSSFFLKDPYSREMGYIGVGGLLNRMGNNLLLYKKNFSEYFVGITDLDMIIIPFLILLVIGLGYAVYSKKGIAELYFILYMFILLIWPFAETERFSLPVVPFIYLYLILSVKGMGSLLWKKHNTRLVCAIFCFLLLFFNFWDLKDNFKYNYINNKLSATRDMAMHLFTKIKHVEPIYAARRLDDPSVLSYVMLSYWLRDNSKDSDIIVGRKPSIAALLSERQVVRYPFSKDGDKIIEYFEDRNISYIIVDTFSEDTQKYLLPVLRRHTERFHAVMGNKYGVIVKFS